MPSSALLLTLTLAGALLAGDINIKVAHRDKEFAFKSVHTWAWHPDGAGGVKMALTANDDPEKMRAGVEPTIMQAVQDNLAARGLTMHPPGEPADVYVAYYVLLSTNMAAETAEIFGASTEDWQLPSLAMQTTNLRVIERGSLVLDVSSVATRTVVWRGVAQAEIDRARSEPDRLARIQQAIKDVIKKLPK